MASTLTYGEQMLAQAERRVRARAAKRRRLTLLTPATLATTWSLADLVAARWGRLDAANAGLAHHAVDHVEVIAWTVVFVVVPMLMAVKPDPLPSGALLSFFAGPILTPLLFGPGGWKLWQAMILTIVVALILAGHREREKARRARAPA